MTNKNKEEKSSSLKQQSVNTVEMFGGLQSPYAAKENW